MCTICSREQYLISAPTIGAGPDSFSKIGPQTLHVRYEALANQRLGVIP